jgi:hypothetical protein
MLLGKVVKVHELERRGRGDHADLPAGRLGVLHERGQVARRPTSAGDDVQHSPRPTSSSQAPLQPPLHQLPDHAGAAAALLAPVKLLQQLGLDLLGLAPGRLGLAADLATQPPLAAGEGVAAGEHLHLEAVPRFLITCSDRSMSFHLSGSPFRSVTFSGRRSARLAADQRMRRR